MKCKNCGTQFEEGIFCPECGAKFVEENVKAKDESVKPKSKKKVLKYIGIIALVYIIISIIVTLLSGGIDDTETRPEAYLEEGKKDANSENGEEAEEGTLVDEEGFDDNGLTYDLATDIANAMLNSDGNGHIVDNDGNIIPEYAYIEILDNGSLYDGDCILEGYSVARNGQLECYMLPEVSY